MDKKNTQLKVHFHRYEFKYLISSHIVEGIIPVFLKYMEIDEFGKNLLRNSYVVSSLYFDSSDLGSYREKIAGIRSRKKLRLRFYNSECNNNSKIFLEIKRKYDSVVVKDRVTLNYQEAEDLIQRNKKPNRALNERDNNIIDEFLWTKIYNSMVPQNMVIYKRMAFVSSINPRFRVTIDYDLKSYLASWINEKKEGNPVTSGFVILEVKFDGILPAWFHKIMLRYNLERIVFSKYCRSLSVCRPELSLIDQQKFFSNQVTQL